MKETENTDFQCARRQKAICGLIEGRSLDEIAEECEISTLQIGRAISQCCNQSLIGYQGRVQKDGFAFGIWGERLE